MGPALDERVGVQRPPHVGGRVPNGPAVREVPGRDLVHGDPRQRRGAEDLQPLLLLLLRPGRVRWGDVVPGRPLGLARCRGRHHRHRPAPRLRCQPDQALPVVVGHQVAFPGERDRLLRPVPRGVKHAVRPRVVADQFPGHRQGRPARIDAGAALGQPPGQPVSLGVGLLGQPAQVHLDPLGTGHQRRQRLAAKRGVGIPRGGGLLHVGDQPCVRRMRGGGQLGGGTGRDAAGQALDPAGQRGRDRSADLVEGGHGGIDRLRPGGELRQPGAVTLLLRGVIPVVAGQVKTAEVDQRVAPVQLELAVHDPGTSLERGQVGFVVRVLQGLAGACRLGQRGQALAHPVRGEVLDRAVVLVPPAVLTRFGQVEVAHRAQPRRQIVHGTRRYRARPGAGFRRRRSYGARPAFPSPGRTTYTASWLPSLAGSLAEQAWTS